MSNLNQSNLYLSNLNLNFSNLNLSNKLNLRNLKWLIDPNLSPQDRKSL